MNIRKPKVNEETELAEMRARTMKESLEKVNRFDENRVRERLLNGYNADETAVIEKNNKVVGFFTISEKVNEFYINHFYIDTEFQNLGYGTKIMKYIFTNYCGKSIKLNALKESKSNKFYERIGFKKISEDEYDNFYIRK